MAYSSRYGALAEYTRSQPARDRAYGGLMDWSATQQAQSIPPTPTDDWIRLYLLAQRVPQSPDSYTQRTMPYLSQVPAIQADITKHVAPFLEDADYQTVETEIANGLTTVMPQLALVDVTQTDIDTWRANNGFATTTTTTTTASTTSMFFGTAAGTTTLSGAGTTMPAPVVNSQADLTASRAAGTAYQNKTAAPMWVSTYWEMDGAGAHVQAMSDANTPPTTVVGDILDPASQGNTAQMIFLVLPGNYYQCVLGGGAPKLIRWIEYSATPATSATTTATTTTAAPTTSV
jgi:hypothetical protein